ncbi:tyrosine-type recombinase/integrase [Alcaligenes faecalis]|uniref:tyrosine-type recombinase/integrase n=1 Tax=Alcaligenes faecalis TaxID=511 RepID=UPI001293A0F1|nr:hypothetical protein [Alcaligenes faecalis]
MRVSVFNHANHIDEYAACYAGIKISDANPGVHNPRSTPISSETMNRALKIMGFGSLQTGHGFRGLASTIMNEQSGFRSEVIERQLAHRDRNKVRRAYNHAQYMAERHDLMQWWSDYLDEQLGKAPK